MPFCSPRRHRRGGRGVAPSLAHLPRVLLEIICEHLDGDSRDVVAMSCACSSLREMLSSRPLVSLVFTARGNEKGVTMLLSKPGRASFLREIDATMCDDLPCTSLSALIERCSASLIEFYCAKIVRPATMRLLVASCPKIQVLEVLNCDSVSFPAASRISPLGNSLRSLTLGMCTLFRDAHLRALLRRADEIPHSVTVEGAIPCGSGGSLEALTLIGSSYISGKALRTVAQSTRSLKTLIVSQCDGWIQNRDVEEVFNSNTGTLSWIDLGGCKGFNRFTPPTFMPSLHTIILDDTTVSDLSLTLLIGCCKDALQRISLSRVSSLYDTAILELIWCPKLKFVDVSYTKVTELAMEYLEDNAIDDILPFHVKLDGCRSVSRERRMRHRRFGNADDDGWKRFQAPERDNEGVRVARRKRRRWF